MVFESLVADILNRFLGDYVENLDRKQLKIGIWGGDVVLDNLILKQTALDDLDLPIKTVYGRLGKLVLKIPWKNLYNAPVIATVEKLFLVAVPNLDIAYDPVKEERWKKDAKHSEINRLEELKKKEAEKNLPKTDDTFVEKLTTQIIKNVQITIKEIHIRYEDKNTNVKNPFSLGITLNNLSVLSTDVNWTESIATGNEKKIYKILNLEGLSLYWNSNSVCYTSLPPEYLTERLQEGIASKDFLPTNYNYILAPINASARLVMNPKPELDATPFSVSKIVFNLELENVDIAINKLQYRDIIACVESMDRMNRGLPYRKFRPNVPGYRGFYREWWHFAYNSVMEQEVLRRRRNWDWKHILDHRNKCKQYANLYRLKLENKKMTPDVEKEIENYEMALSIVNITIIRKQIEVEVELLGELAKKRAASQSWWSGWFGQPSNSEDLEIKTAADIMKKFEATMTTEEKTKLYKAIDYTENVVPTEYPVTYVAMVLNFKLNKIGLQVKDETLTKCVLLAELSNVHSEITQRPSADAIKISLDMHSFSVFGLEQQNTVPELVTSMHITQNKLLAISFETNPLDSTVNQRLKITAQPLQIIYDAQTVIELLNVFKTPYSLALEQLQQVANSKLQYAKQQSANGLQHAIEKTKSLEISIDWAASYVIVPYGGFYTGFEPLFVANLGRITMSTEKRAEKKVVDLHKAGSTEAHILQELMAQSYEKYTINIEDIQLLMAFEGEEWEDILKKAQTSEIHLLQPTSLKIYLQRSLVEDPRLARLKVNAELPTVTLSIADVRLLKLFGLLASIPLPKSGIDAGAHLETVSISSSVSAVFGPSLELEKVKKKSLESVQVSSDFTQTIDIVLNFILRDLHVLIYRHVVPGTQSLSQYSPTEASPNETSELEKILKCNIMCLETNIVMKTFETEVAVRLGGIGVKQYRELDAIHVISTPFLTNKNEYLFEMNYTQVDSKSPEFRSKYNSCEQFLNMKMSEVSVILHQEGIKTLLEIQNKFIIELDNIKSEVIEREIAPTRSGITFMPDISEELVIKTKQIKRSKTAKKKPKENILIKIDAKLQNVLVVLENNKRQLAQMGIKGLEAGFVMKTSKKHVFLKLNDLSVIDPNPSTHHTQILSVTSGEVIHVQIVMFDRPSNDYNKDDIDMSIVCHVGGAKIFYLNWFISSVLNFLNNFQTAQDAIIKASSAAATTAKQNVQIVYEAATRVQLTIRVKAPEIYIPINSKSFNAIHVDLGKLHITNKFITLEYQNEQGHFAVIDEMNIQLDNVKLSRVELNKDNTVVKECLLLKPITFSLLIRRNLTSSWYKRVADIDIVGRLKTIEANFSHEDYAMVLNILSENLSEHDEEDSIIDVPNRMPYRDSVGHGDILKKSSLKQVDELVLIDDDHSKVFLKFTFTMDSLIINLYSGGSIKETNTSSYSPENGLARFRLDVLSIKGRQLAGSEMYISMVLLDCILDDSRPWREDKLNRMLSRRITAEDNAEGDSNIRSMIDITFQKKMNNHFIDIRVYSFNMILAMDYLMTVANFFVISTENPPTETDDNYLIQHIESGTNKSMRSARSSKAAAGKRDTAASDASNLTLNIRIEKPDIVLVENMNCIDTDAMILNCEVILKVRLNPLHQVINGSIKDFTVVTCNYNPEKRQETKFEVLEPLWISIAGSTPAADVHQGLHIDVIVTDIKISVCPTTIELLNRVLVTMYSSSNEVVEKKTELGNFGNLWTQQEYKTTDFWFLRTDEAMEAADYFHTKGGKVSSVLNEMCLISLPVIKLTLDSGVSKKTLPMILVRSGIQATVGNWSTEMYVDASMTLQMDYYNNHLAIWEPLIETIEHEKTRVPWELKFELQMNNVENPVSSYQISSEGSEETVDESMTQTARTITISSKDNLEITVTKTALEVLNNLSKAFANAVKERGYTKITAVAPYEVQNDTGLEITLMLGGTQFEVVDKPSYDEVQLESGAKVYLNLKKFIPKRKTSVSSDIQLLKDSRRKSVAVEGGVTDEKENKILTVKIKGMISSLELPVSRADKRYFPLNRADQNEKWGFISDIAMQDNRTIITLRSILQVFNHFDQAIDVYYMTERGNEVEFITSVKPKETVNLPVQTVYTPTSEIFFGLPGYTVSATPFIWRDLQLNLALAKLLECRPKPDKPNKTGFYLRVRGEIEQIYNENTNIHTMASLCYQIHLCPAVSFRNCLPLPIIICLSNSIDETTLEPGILANLPVVEPGRSFITVRISDYLDKEWSCKWQMPINPPEFLVWGFDSYDSDQKCTLHLGIHVSTVNGATIISLYCPFWMLNKTGLMLTYRSSEDAMNVLYHPEHFKGPILFSFSSKYFFGKKKAAIRVENGDWSSKFSLDVAGSSGVINCRSNNKIYQIGVHNQLTYNGLTKQVTFTPFYIVLNNAPFVILIQETDRPGDAWVKVEPGKCCPFWPMSDREDKLLRIKVEGTTHVSASFLITEVHTTLLKLNNRYGGVNVDVQVNEGGVYITFNSYAFGLAPALIINQTHKSINFWESNSINIRSIDPSHYLFYTWENPSGTRLLVWDIGHKMEEFNDLRKDGIGQISIDAHDKVYWVSFLDGIQRIILFTEFEDVARNAQSAGSFESVDQEINVAIHGVGISFVNNLQRKEIMYMGIASTGVIWEVSKVNGRRFKPLCLRDCLLIEHAYQTYLTQIEVKSNQIDSHVVIDSKLEIDFESWQMFKPNKRVLRRTFQTGLWVQIKSAPHQFQLHAKINRLQIDNQLHDCIFPVVLAPVALPKSVAANSALKPFAELSIVQRIMPHSTVQQYKYFKVLIQEFHIKFDLGFINEVLSLLETDEVSEKEKLELFRTDMDLVNQPLLFHVETKSLRDQKNFYDLLHFSPLKIHVSFSMQSGSSSASSNTPEIISVLLQGIGVTLTDMQDVIFRLAYFEREYTFLSQNTLTSEVTKHYVGQLIKQLYVLVFGLDVLGNPYGLVLGIKKGVEDLFYEPFQGAIQGPGEFAEGLALGVRSLFGHTVGGAAGAVSRITGAMGKGIAALTFDDEYQRKRRDLINKRPANIQEGIARGGKGIVMGVFDGVTGVFSKPISGAKEHGVEGFFKGLGKGALGLVTRPTAGVVDFASGSFDAVKRATEVDDEISRLRPPRFLQADLSIIPFCRMEAEGHKLLIDLEKGKYATTDVYVYHVWIVERRDILLLTDKRIAYVIHNDIFGGWQIDWSYTWKDLASTPQATDRGIYIALPDSKKKMLNFFGSSDQGKLILIEDANIRKRVMDKVLDVYKRATA